MSPHLHKVQMLLVEPLLHILLFAFLRLLGSSLRCLNDTLLDFFGELDGLGLALGLHNLQFPLLGFLGNVDHWNTHA